MKIGDNKLNHLRGVAEYMYQNAERFGLEPEEAFVLGMLHDIGYINDRAAKREIPDLTNTGTVGHEWYGAELLKNMGLRPDFVNAIRYHGTDPKNVPVFLHCPAMELLWEADMSIDKYGRNVGFGGRLADIGHRYGYDSDAYKTASETILFLKERARNRDVDEKTQNAVPDKRPDIWDKYKEREEDGEHEL